MQFKMHKLSLSGPMITCIFKYSSTFLIVVLGLTETRSVFFFFCQHYFHLYREVQKQKIFVTLPILGGGWPRGYKAFFMLISDEREIYPAHQC